jgi:hypothetical protein
LLQHVAGLDRHVANVQKMFCHEATYGQLLLI